MSVVYRAFVQLDSDSARDVARRAFSHWLAAKAKGRFPPPERMRLPAEGERLVAGSWQVESRCETTPALSVERVAITQEDSPGERWSTDITAWDLVDPEEHWVWVECSRVSDSPWASRARSIPGIVDHLLDPAHRPRFGNTPLLNSVFAAADDGRVRRLATTILDPGRQLPVIVSTSDEPAPAEDVFRRVKGNALVAHVARPEDRATLAGLLGPDLDIHDGSLRIYLPGVDRRDPRPWRHRYVARHRLELFDGRSWDRVTAPVVRIAAQLRPPSSYRDQVHHLLRPRWSDADIEQLMNRVSDLEDERDWLREEFNQTRERLRTTLDEKDELSRDLDQSRREARWLRDQQPDTGAAHQDDDAETEPSVRTFSDVIEMFESSWVMLGEGVTLALDLDDEPERSTWAQTARRALDSLDRYARAKAAGYRGSFENWLTSTDNDLRTSVVPTESSLTKKDKKFARLRTFEVPTEVSSTGEVVMWAHIRIGDTGPTPRLHYHDDTGGTTGKVYVGYIGPHLDTAGTRRRRD